MPTEKQIEENINKSTAKYRAKREKAQLRKKQIAEGNKFVLEKNISVFAVNYLGEEIAIGIWPTGNTTRSTIAFCSPKDNWSNRIAKGLVGYRLKNEYPAIVNNSHIISPGYRTILGILSDIEECYMPQRLARKVRKAKRDVNNKDRILTNPIRYISRIR